jgi:hypothetical protein
MSEREINLAFEAATRIFCALLQVRQGISPGAIADEAWQGGLALVAALDRHRMQTATNDGGYGIERLSADRTGTVSP